MQQFIKSFLLILWLFTGVDHLFAQINKPDIIVKTDKSQITGRVVGTDPSAIRYQRLRETTIRKINMALVPKVMYGTGVVRMITPPSAPPVVETDSLDTLVSESTKAPPLPTSFEPTANTSPLGISLSLAESTCQIELQSSAGARLLFTGPQTSPYSIGKIWPKEPIWLKFHRATLVQVDRLAIIH